tara:strand:+ start:10459 stop:11463 length:1005 start_codon:yes stop_codon:yes gene_type:complete
MVYILAEIGVNHNGSIDLAFKLIDVAIKAGVDGVKFQTFNSKKIVTRFAEKAEYQKKNTSVDESQFDMLNKLELSQSDFKKIQSYCKKNNIDFISTPFDIESADFLNTLNLDTFKIGSGDLTNFPLLKRVSSFKKKIILSTGMSSMEEVDSSVNYIRKCGCNNITLLHCVSCYPTEDTDLNLLCIKSMQDKFNIPVGFSDHTTDSKASLYSICLGATVIEKHFTLDKNMEGPDHKASLDPDELREFVTKIRECEIIMGNGIKKCRNNEKNTKIVSRRSLYFSRNLKKGDTLKEDDLIALRPNTGVCASEFNYFIGKTLNADVNYESAVTYDICD